MKLGIVGPIKVVERAHTVLKKANPDIEIVNLIYEEYTQSPGIVQAAQEKVDAVLFMGKTPFKLCEAKIRAAVPWEYIDRQSSTLLRTLLEVSHIRKLDIRKISFDTYTADMLYEAYQDIGINRDELDIYIAEQRLVDDNYGQYLLDFHKHNYYQNKVSCCVSGITEICRTLNGQNIPCILTAATTHNILLAYNKLELKYLAKQNQSSQIVIIAVRIELPKSYSIDQGDEYIYMLKKYAILDKVYLFASKIEAAVVENEGGEFLLFTTKRILETETHDLQDIYLLDLLRDTEAGNVDIGIGYGETVRQAKMNAYEGVTRASKAGGGVAFAVYSYGKIRGPFRFHQKDEEGQNWDLSVISSKSGVSSNTIHKIYKAVMQTNEREFTSKELAAICNISKRNMDRIIQKLENTGFCDIVGQRIMSDIGRPSRIIRFTKF